MSAFITPDQLMLSIRLGQLDNQLDDMVRWIQLRREVIANDMVAQLKVGDKVVLTNISPQLLDGCVVQVKEFDGAWIRCELLSHTGSHKWHRGKTVRIRRGHVGAIQSET